MKLIQERNISIQKGGGNKTGYKNIDKFESENITEVDVFNFVSKQISPIIERYQRILQEETIRKTKYVNLFGKFLNKEIRLINGTKDKVTDSNNTRFKFLKGFLASDEYMDNNFIKELQFLDSKNIDIFVFMIPRYHSYYNNLGFDHYIRVDDFNNKILEFFKSFGFTNIDYLK